MPKAAAIDKIATADFEVDPGLRKDAARKIAQEWFAITELQPGMKGMPVPFAHLDHIPATQTALAKEIGVSSVTISVWKNTDDAFKRGISYRKKRHSSDSLLKHIGTIDDIVVQKARKGDAKFVRLFYEQVAKREDWESLKWEEMPDGVDSIDSIIVMIRATATRIKSAMNDANDITDVVTQNVRSDA